MNERRTEKGERTQAEKIDGYRKKGWKDKRGRNREGDRGSRKRGLKR